MNEPFNRKKMTLLLLGGILGCILMGGSDWLMIYGDPSCQGALAWLTVGVGAIPPWRNSLAMALAFPAVLFYSLGLFGIRSLLPSAKHRKLYSYLTALGLTPWLALHLFYGMLFYLFSLFTCSGQAPEGAVIIQQMVAHFGWLIPVSDFVMVLPFLYLFFVTVTGHTVLPRWLALNNPLILFVLLKALTGLLGDTAFHLAFLNGLMSESMLIFFLVLVFTLPKPKK